MEEVPEAIWAEIDTIIQEVSDETGEEDLGNGFLLKYEGWTGSCIEHIWDKVLEQQESERIDTESPAAIEEREAYCYEYADRQTDKILDDEWIPKMKERGFIFLHGSYDSGGLYGRTWALFKKSEEDS